jgi:hypothetical protein
MKRVEVAGDFSAGRPIPLYRNGGKFSRRLDIPAGAVSLPVHRRRPVEARSRKQRYGEQCVRRAGKYPHRQVACAAGGRRGRFLGSSWRHHCLPARDLMSLPVPASSSLPRFQFAVGHVIGYYRQNFDQNNNPTASFRHDVEVVSSGIAIGGLSDAALVTVSTGRGCGAYRHRGARARRGETPHP